MGSVGNAGQSLGNYIIMAFNAMFALNQKDLEKNQPKTWCQYWYNSMAVIVVQCLYFLLLCWMPRSFDHAKATFQSAAKSTGWASLALVLIVFCTVWGTLSAVMAFACPCNQIFGGDGCSPGFWSCGYSD